MKLLVSALLIMLSLPQAARAAERLYPCGPGNPVVEHGVRCDPNLWLFAIHLTAKDGVSHAMILAGWTDVSMPPDMRRTVYMQTVRASRQPGAPAGSPAAIDVCIYTTSIRAPLRHVTRSGRDLSVCCEKETGDRAARASSGWWRRRSQPEDAGLDLCEVPYGFPLPAPAGRDSSPDAIDERAIRSLLSALLKLPWRSEWSDERATLEALARTDEPSASR